MTPVEPPKKAIGTNTADSTSAMPISAPVIWPMDLRVASRGSSPSSSMIRSTFSTTTMASSTRRPMASTMASMVSVLMVKPKAAMIPNVPRSTMGTASVGISVARQLCRKIYITTKTSTMASISVLITSSMEISTKGEVSKGITYSTPSGKNWANSSIRAFTRSAVSSALAPGARLSAIPEAGRPL